MDKIDIAENVRRELVGKGLTLALAESCTGGALAARLTAVPGSSHYFLGSLVCYSNALKKSVLGVSEETLRKYGAVSEQTVREMVLGGLRLTGSDFAIANTGVAGPGGGTEEKPVGTVWMAIARKEGKVISWSLCYKGTRQEVIRQTVDTLLEALLLQVT